MRAVQWPLMCFIAVLFWNMLGAGVFGFMINTPLALFYLQGLNKTAVHAHAALFGVYGFLAIGFVLLVLRYIRTIGDVVFIVGAQAIAWQVVILGLWRKGARRGDLLPFTAAVAASGGTR